MKAIIVNNDFDRESYHEIAKVAEYLINKATKLNDYIMNQWHYNDIKDEEKESIKNDINEFLSKFGTESNPCDSFLINNVLEIGQVYTAKAYLKVIRDMCNNVINEEQPICVIASGRRSQ